MTQSSVTVLVTVKNSANTIKKCIRSLLRLDYKNYKIYVVDAFSKDGTYEILKKFGKKIKLEQLLANVPKAYNHALKKINTEFVAFTDADCVITRDWLKNLVSCFISKKIVASAGRIKTPKNMNMLQKTIGIELENRFRNFPKYLSRAPTMNLCVRADIAKKLGFDEELNIGYDTDFGYRLLRMKRLIVYEPQAIVYHFHRSTWKSFFRQQFIYGKFSPLIYLKHPKRTVGDHISTPTMMIQPPIFFLILLFIALSFLNKMLINISFVLFFILFFLYTYNILKLSRSNLKETLYFFPLFFIRTSAWTFGALTQMLNIIFYRRDLILKFFGQ